MNTIPKPARLAVPTQGFSDTLLRANVVSTYNGNAFNFLNDTPDTLASDELINEYKFSTWQGNGIANQESQTGLFHGAVIINADS